jgi:hypothetical protein
VPKPGVDYATLRSYAFGEAFIATRGVALASLDSYFALRFQALGTTSVDDRNFLGEDVRETVPPPLGTWFERSGYEVRTGWLELKNFLPARFRLSKLRVRAGSQYIYGPWVLHVDGLHVAYEGPIVTATGYSGIRHSDYTRDQPDARPGIAGSSLRIDLRGLRGRASLPLALEGHALVLSQSETTGEAGVTTTQLQLDWRPSRDTVVLAQTRNVNGELASQRVELRTRFREVTNLVFDITRRLAGDWRWDPSLVSRPTAIGMVDTEARRYLDLGPVLPQWIASARAGTLFRENIDIVARLAIARDTDDNVEQSTYVAPYFELGGGLEVRLRRQLALGVTGLTRRRTRPSPPPTIVDAPNRIEALPEVAQLGQDRFTEVGTTLKLSLGARRFSTLLEVYGRATTYAHAYLLEVGALPERDVRGGARVSLDAWVGRRIRLFVTYDVSSLIDTAPDVSGFKTLRMMMTGVY